MMNKKNYCALMVIAAGLILAACVHEAPVTPVTDPGTSTPTTPPSTPPPAGKTCSADSVYFSNDILPLITSNCSMSTCHGGSRSPTLTTYTQISRNRGNIQEQISRGEMPIPPVALLSSSQISMFNKWVNQGAKNNSCTAACDTTKFTYTAVIDPMMKRYCVGCHTGATASNKNVDLSTYAGVKAAALSGQLYKSVAHLPGAVAMPPTGTSLSTCEVTQIKKWIAAGALN
jgi:cytochrome c553